MTETGKYSTREEDLDALAEFSEFFAAYKSFRQTGTLINSFVGKMQSPRIHPHYDLLKNTGRTSSSGPNIQGFPKKPRKKGKADFDLRGCFVPGPGKVFYVADYSNVELRTLSQALRTQFRLELPHGGGHQRPRRPALRVVAARMKATRPPEGSAAILADPARLNELAGSLTDAGRDAAKPANFGLAGGDGPCGVPQRVCQDQL